MVKSMGVEPRLDRASPRSSTLWASSDEPGGRVLMIEPGMVTMMEDSPSGLRISRVASPVLGFRGMLVTSTLGKIGVADLGETVIGFGLGSGQRDALVSATVGPIHRGELKLEGEGDKADTLAVALELALLEADGEEEEELLRERVVEGVGVDVRVPDGVGLTDEVEVLEGEVLPESEEVPVRERVGDRLTEGDEVAVPVLDLVGVCEELEEGEELGVRVLESLEVGVRDGLSEPDAEEDQDTDSDAEADQDTDGLRVGVRVGSKHANEVFVSKV